MVDRKWWILHSLYAHGTLLVDEGAFKAMANHSASLFAAGVVGVEGDFNDQEAVRIVLAKQDTEKNVIVRVEIGKGIVNYTSSEVERVKGLHSHDIARILGYQDAECIVHRDNLVITKAPAEVHQE
jgi:glutamate 5-kinase